MTLGAAEADMSTATVVPHARCSAGQAALVRADDGRVEPRANSAPSFAGGNRRYVTLTKPNIDDSCGRQ